MRARQHPGRAATSAVEQVRALIPEAKAEIQRRILAIDVRIQDLQIEKAHLALELSKLDPRAGVPRGPTAQERVRDAINGTPIKPRQIAQATGLNIHSVYGALAVLKRNRAIQSVGRGAYTSA